MHKVKVLLTEPVTHDVNRYILEKPVGYKFTPGQAVNIAINKKSFEDKLHEFTFTSLNQDKVLEFTIKSYDPKKVPDHEGVTWELLKLSPGDELLIENEPWGTIQYKGKGVFIAGGAGITPFIAIFKDLYKKGKLSGNKLIFSNKQKRDIILEKEFENMFDQDDLVLTLTREKRPGYEHGRIDEAMVRKYIDDFSQHLYICGPKPFIATIKETLAKLGAKTDSVVFEE